MVPYNILLAALTALGLFIWLGWDGLRAIFIKSKRPIDGGDINALILLGATLAFTIIILVLGISNEPSKIMWLW